MSPSFAIVREGPYGQPDHVAVGDAPHVAGGWLDVPGPECARSSRTSAATPSTESTSHLPGTAPSTDRRRPYR